MNLIFMMLGVTTCYTITSLSDKYAAAKVGLSGDEFTFLMCSSMSVFLSLTLPFQQLWFTLSPQSFAAVLAVAVCKLLEFKMSAAVLRQLSAFELKAWLGVTLFISYFTDVLYGAALNLAKLGCLVLTAAGLVLIVSSGDKKANSQRQDNLPLTIDYRRIALPLILYLLSKYRYGLVIKAFTPYVSPTMQLLPALILIALVMLARVSPPELVRTNPKGIALIVLARIPNTIGMLLENAVISISLTNYSLIQPMILVTLFIISVIRRESRSPLNLVGSLLCILGIAVFQISG